MTTGGGEGAERGMEEKEGREVMGEGKGMVGGGPGGGGSWRRRTACWATTVLGASALCAAGEYQRASSSIYPSHDRVSIVSGIAAAFWISEDIFLGLLSVDDGTTFLMPECWFVVASASRMEMVLVMTVKGIVNGV